jgi:glycosyltransferase involved in cell wall biosynthesis
MEINFVSNPNSTSYGLVAFNLIKSLTKLGVKVNLFPIDGRGLEATTQDERSLIDQCMKNSLSYDINAPSVRLWHQFDLNFHVGNGLRVGFPIFELDGFTDKELSDLSHQDRLIVCSQWAKDVLVKNGINVPTRVVPLGVDTDIFYPHPIKTGRLAPTRFYNVGKMEYRKGHDVLLTAFEQAFTEGDNVELHMLWYNRLLPQEHIEGWKRYYRSSKLANKIHLYDWVPSQQDLSALLNNMHVGVFISRAEGWDLGLLESMAKSKHIIATNYSGHTEFANNENAILIEVGEPEVAQDGIWFKGQGKWASLGEAQIISIAVAMRNCHNYIQRGGSSDDDGIQTAKTFSWENSALRLLEALK